MASLAVTIKQKTLNPKRILVELDADRFERLAANLGFFNTDFIRSLEKAEDDFGKGRVKKIKSLKDLR